MFDIGFAELMLIFLVGLIVLGPQRMPVAIRTVMGWVRTVRGLAHSVQTELTQELKLQELQESIKKAEALNIGSLSPELNKTVEELKQSAQKMQETLNSAKGEVQGLSDEQVAEIQNRIETENQQLNARNDEVQLETEDTANYSERYAEIYQAAEPHPDLVLPDEHSEIAKQTAQKQEKSNVS